MDKTATTCPQCHSSVPFHQGFVSWCECGWNVGMPAQWADDRKMTRRCERMRRLHKAFADAWTAGRPLAQPLAVVVSAFLTLLVLLGLAAYIALMVYLFADPFVIGRGLAVILLIGLYLPVAPLLQFPRQPFTVVRPEAPRTFEQLDRICRLLRVRQVNQIQISESLSGMRLIQPLWRRKRILVCGLSTLAALDAASFTAGAVRELLIARRNRRSLWDIAAWARDLLQTAYDVIVGSVAHPSAPDGSVSADRAQYSRSLRMMRRQSFVRMLNAFTFPIAVIPQSLHFLLNRNLQVLLHATVYRADRQTARLTGLQPLEQYLTSLSLVEPLQFAQDRLGETAFPQDRLAAMADKVRTLPQRERERQLRTQPEDGLQRPLLGWQFDLLQRCGQNDPLPSSMTAAIPAISLSDWPIVNRELTASLT